MSTEIKADIKIRTDKLSVWQNSTLELKKGEMAIATSTVVENGTEKEIALIKVANADGQTWSEIPDFAYAKAADVITACKSTEGLTTFVNNLITTAFNNSGKLVEQNGELLFLM
jgi:hypothetical protein